MGNLVLNLWDCGGQEAFMEHYFSAQRDNIFRNVEVLIYVFDVESREIDKDIHYYQSWYVFTTTFTIYDNKFVKAPSYILV